MKTSFYRILLNVRSAMPGALGMLPLSESDDLLNVRFWLEKDQQEEPGIQLTSLTAIAIDDPDDSTPTVVSFVDPSIISEYNKRGSVEFLKWWNSTTYAQIEGERASLQARLDHVGDNHAENEVLEKEIFELEKWLALITNWFTVNRFALPVSLRNAPYPQVEEDATFRRKEDEKVETVPSREGYTLSAFREEYITYVRTNMAPKTVENLERVMKSFIAFLGDKLLADLTLIDIEKYKQERKGKVADSTINIDVRTLKAAMELAVAWGKIPANPFRLAKNIRVTQKAKSHLTEDEVTRLLAVIKEDWYKRVVRFAMLTGLRRGEILNLRPADYDPKTGVITIQSSSTYRVKGGKFRQFALNQQAMEILSATPDGSIWMFTDGDGNQIREGLATKKFKAYVKAAGLPADLHFHSLRHTFATLASNKGMTTPNLKTILGHSSIKTTEGYIGADDETIRAQMMKVSLSADVADGHEDDQASMEPGNLDT